MRRTTYAVIAGLALVRVAFGDPGVPPPPFWFFVGYSLLGTVCVFEAFTGRDR